MTFKTNLIYLLKIIILSIPVALLIWIVNNYTINSLRFEDYIIIKDFIDMDKFHWQILFKFNNEHIILFPKIILFVMAYLSHYNTKVMLIPSTILLSLTYYIFVRFTVKKRITNFNIWDIIYSLSIGFCLFSIAQYENMLWNFQVAWYLIEFCLVAGMSTLSLYIKTRQNKYIICSIIFAVIAAFSSLHGALIGFCYMAVVAVYQFSERKFDKKIWFILIGSAIAVCYLYMLDYIYNLYNLCIETAYLTELHAKSLASIIRHFLKCIGGILLDTTLALPTIINGVILLVIFGFLFLLLVKNKKIKDNIIPLGLCFYAIGFALMIGLGRGNHIIYSRYITYSLLLFISILAMLKQYINFDTYKGKLALFTYYAFFVACTLNQVHNSRRLEEWKTDALKSNSIMLSYKTKSLKELNTIAFPPIKTRKKAIEDFEKIEKANLSIFYK